MQCRYFLVYADLTLKPNDPQPNLYTISMNKKLLWIVIPIILAIGGGVAYLMLNQNDTPQQAESTQEASTAVVAIDQPIDPAPDSAATNGTYTQYSAEAVANTPGTKLIFFHAPWCPQCRALEADIQAKGVPAGVTIFKVDYDSNQALRQKYGVTLQTTVVLVDDQGNLVKKYVAYDEPTLQSVKDNLL